MALRERLRAAVDVVAQGRVVERGEVDGGQGPVQGEQRGLDRLVPQSEVLAPPSLGEDRLGGGHPLAEGGHVLQQLSEDRFRRRAGRVGWCADGTQPVVEEAAHEGGVEVLEQRAVPGQRLVESGLYGSREHRRAEAAQGPRRVTRVQQPGSRPRSSPRVLGRCAVPDIDASGAGVLHVGPPGSVGAPR
jgi:hypothetical protein